MWSGVCQALPVVLAVILGGTSCESVKTGAAGGGGLEVARSCAQVRDLTPVTLLETPSHAPVELVRDGKPRAVVYVADPRGRANFDPRDYRQCNAPFPPVLPRLVHELLEVIRLSTGGALEQVDRPPRPGQPAIIIGDCEETRLAGIDAAQLPIEGFVVKTARDRVYLVGSTQPLPPGGMGANEGTAWAVADFLERCVGVRWYWPAAYGGRSIPRMASLIVPPLHYRDEPVFRERTFHPEQVLLLPLSYAPHYATPRETMSLPLPFAPGVLPDGESYVTMVPHLALMRYGASLPYLPKMQGARAANVASAAAQRVPRVEAMFALKQDGRRDYGVFCYSAPEALAYVLDCCAQVWDRGQGVGEWITPSAINLWFPATPGLACRCAACGATAATYRDDRELSARLTAQHGERGAFERIEQRVHERVFGLFVQRVSEAVKQRWPDKKVIYHPWGTSCPEGVVFADNLVVQNLDGGYMMGLLHQPAIRRQKESDLRAWANSVKGPSAGSGSTRGPIVSARFGFYGPSDWTLGPVQYPHVVQSFYRTNQDFIAGSMVPTYSLPCWTTAAPTWYVWMRVLWNPDLDVDAVLDELCRRLFGAGAESARALLRLECERWEGAQWTRPLLQEAMREAGEGSLRFPDDEHFRQSWPADVVARMKVLRDQALAAIADDPQAQQAFLYWTWTFDAFVKYAASVYGNESATAETVPRGPSAEARGALGIPSGGPDGSLSDAFRTVFMKTNAADGAVMVLIPAGEFRMGTSEAERRAWFAAHPDRSLEDLVKATVAEGHTSFAQFWRSTNEAQRAAWLQQAGATREHLFQFRDEMPQRTVHVDAYYMYQTEVTVGQYRKFCQATGRSMPPEPRQMAAGGRKPAAGAENLPVVNVTWQDARAYAAWAGAALPTEAEWEKAARGGEQRLFPWGEAWPPPAGAGNFADATFGAQRLPSRYFLDAYTDGYACSAPVGAFAANPYGVHDMAGNVAEWCADWYAADYYGRSPKRNPSGPSGGVWHVVRGGSWRDAVPWAFRAASRGDYVHLPVGTASFAVGFRCVVRAPNG
jgi:formylglycine-generating enzyme required for sulfatase activity